MTIANVITEDKAKARMTEVLKPGMVVYYQIIRAATNNGTRDFRVFIVEDGEINNITAYAGRAIGARVVDYQGEWVIRRKGDDGQSIIQYLSQAIFGKWQALKGRRL